MEKGEGKRSSTRERRETVSYRTIDERERERESERNIFLCLELKHGSKHNVPHGHGIHFDHIKASLPSWIGSDGPLDVAPNYRNRQ